MTDSLFTLSLALTNISLCALDCVSPFKEAAEELTKCKMIRFDPLSGHFGATSNGRAASHFYVHHETVYRFESALRSDLDPPGVLFLLCSAMEFEQIKLREEEAMELHRLEEECCFYPVKGESEQGEREWEWKWERDWEREKER